MWNWLKSLFGGNSEGESSGQQQELPEIPWVDAEESPWGVPILDVRPVTLNMLSMSRDRKTAERLIALETDDGSRFAGTIPEPVVEYPIKIRYRVDSVLRDGPLFMPREMEHKWGIYYYDGKIICVRSWTHEVMVVAEVVRDGDFVEVHRQHGMFFDEGDFGPDMERRTLDYLIRSHCLGEHYPVPVDEELTEMPGLVAMQCMSMFGNMAIAATHHLLPSEPPETPLRTNSLLHIAVAQKDIPKIREQLEQGTPPDLLAADGLSTLHWALAAEGEEVMQILLDAGCPVDVPSFQGATPLMNAVQSDMPQQVTFLLEHGADVNATDHRGFTALHRSAEMGNAKITQILMQHGADADKDAEGHTPRSLAEGREEKGILKLLG